MERLIIKNNKGQTAIEYILLLLVLTTIITSLVSYMKVKYLGDPLKCQTMANRQTLLCKINDLISPNINSEKKFQYYPFKK